MESRLDFFSYMLDRSTNKVAYHLNERNFGYSFMKMHLLCKLFRKEGKPSGLSNFYIITKIGYNLVWIIKVRNNNKNKIS